MEQLQGIGKEAFEAVNKLIFVKAYKRADAHLQSMLDGFDISDDNLLMHLRRIELGPKLGLSHELVRQYQIMDSKQSTTSSRVCVLFAKHFAESISPLELVNECQDYLNTLGPHFALYYGLGMAYELLGVSRRAIINYEQSIKLNSYWYPSYFGLSQIYYALNKMSDGDQYFFSFEKMAPYNVYGNFETHRDLYREFMASKMHEEAIAAIETLSEWWHENKGRCPDEIQIYEYLSVGHAKKSAGNEVQGQELIVLAHKTAEFILYNDDTEISLLYFLARVFEEFQEADFALRFYQQVLESHKVTVEMVQRIGALLISRKDPAQAASIFEESHRKNPENHEIRFCYLVAKLKKAKVDIESYLGGKERLKALMEADQDSVEALALLHSLVAQFEDDPDLHGSMGELHARLGNFERAKKHYERMYALDPYSSDTILRLAQFYVETMHPDRALDILQRCDLSSLKDQNRKNEMLWIQANIAQQNSDFRGAVQIISGLQKNDPWNVSYLIQRIRAQEKIAVIDGQLAPELLEAATVYDAILNDEKENIQWKNFWLRSDQYEQAGAHELVYLRAKIGLMYEASGFGRVKRIIRAAIRYQLDEALRDLLGLVNTNFDAPEVYWGLGFLHKELWQLEVSTMWLQQGLERCTQKEELYVELMAELSDNYLWQGQSKKAIEYAQMAMDSQRGNTHHLTAATTLSHAYLRNGDLQRARYYLEMIEGEQSFDSLYLKGLLHYRDGHEDRAKKIWKPLIKQASLTPRSHYMKKQLMGFYFDATPYLKAN